MLDTVLGEESMVIGMLLHMTELLHGEGRTLWPQCSSSLACLHFQVPPTTQEAASSLARTSQETSGNQAHDNTVCCLFPASELLAWMGWGQDVHIANAQAASAPCLLFTFSVQCSSPLPLFLRRKFLELVLSPLQPICLGLIVEIDKLLD